MYVVIITHYITKIVELTYCIVATLWENIQTRILSNFDIAAHCYYEFLKLDVTDTESTSSPHIAATLRLLRLLVKYGHLTSKPLPSPISSSSPPFSIDPISPRPVSPSPVSSFSISTTKIGTTLAEGFSSTPPGT